MCACVYIYLQHRSSQSLCLVAKGGGVSSDIAISEDNTHAATNMAVRLAEDSDASILLCEHVVKVVIERLVAVGLGKNNSRCASVLELDIVDRETEDGAAVKLKL